MAGNLSQGQVLYEFESYRLDPVQRVLWRGDELVPLAPKAFDILLTLVESAGRPVDKKDLLDRVWPDTFVEEGSLTQSISILRKVLEQSGGSIQYIQTISKRGYRFSAAVKLLERGPGMRTCRYRTAVAQIRRLKRTGRWQKLTGEGGFG
jgi:DNA-binding winged helix-turn-helix (wHTH) protein